MVSTNELEFDVHGIVRIRLIGASREDAMAVSRQLGLPPGRPGDAEAEIVITYVPSLEPQGALWYLGLNQAAADDQSFYVLRGTAAHRRKARVPVDRVGNGPVEVMCERGIGPVPLLTAMVNETTLGSGVVPLHAAAFQFEGVGVLVTGWAKGGKTETLLAFMSRGARYVGDEWVYVSESGKLHGIPEPIKLWDWHLDEAPEYRRFLGIRERARLRGLRWVGRALGSGRGPLGRAGALLERQRFVHLPPDRLFGSSNLTHGARLDAVVLAVSHDLPGVIASRIDPAELASRVVHSTAYERRDLLAHYEMLRFAFPGRRNAVLEDGTRREEEVLVNAFAGRPCFELRHPFPAPVPALFDVLAPLVRDVRQGESPS